MEWLVPILFVLASLVQWWMQRNRQGQEEQSSEANPTRDRQTRPSPPESPEEFSDFGDLMEALGRRRHEAPPATTEPMEPPVLPASPPKTVALPKLGPSPEPVIVLESPRPGTAPVLTVFPKPKSLPTPEPAPVFVLEESARSLARPFPAARPAEALSTHRWGDKLRSAGSTRDAIVLSEILAPPVSLR